MVSAHWIEKEFSIIDRDDPGLLFDYYNFPKEAYEIKYNIRSTKALREEVIQTLHNEGISLRRDQKWQYDHGTFIPLSILYPNPTIPVIQISLKEGMNPGDHYDLGVKLSSLRSRGYLILGSGMTFHNMRGFGDS